MFVFKYLFIRVFILLSLLSYVSIINEDDNDDDDFQQKRAILFIFVIVYWWCLYQLKNWICRLRVLCKTHVIWERWWYFLSNTLNMTRADGVMATANNNLLKSKYTFTSTQLKKKKNLFFTNTHILNHDHFTVLYSPTWQAFMLPNTRRQRNKRNNSNVWQQLIQMTWS